MNRGLCAQGVDGLLDKLTVCTHPRLLQLVWGRFVHPPDDIATQIHAGRGTRDLAHDVIDLGAGATGFGGVCDVCSASVDAPTKGQMLWWPCSSGAQGSGAAIVTVKRGHEL